MSMTIVLPVLAGVFLLAYLMRREARIRWLRGTGTPAKVILNLILKSTALAMGGVSLGGAIFRAFSTEAHLALLSLGLLALALSTLQKADE